MSWEKRGLENDKEREKVQVNLESIMNKWETKAYVGYLHLFYQIFQFRKLFNYFYTERPALLKII